LGLKKFEKEKKFILLQCIKNISLENFEIQEQLYNTGVLEILVEELKIYIKSNDIHDLFGLSYKMYSQILNTIFNLCNNWFVAPKRINLLSEICVNEIIYIIKNDLPLNNFAYKILFGFTMSTSDSCKNFIKNDGNIFLFDCLNKNNKEREWDDMLLESVISLFKHDKTKIESYLLKNIKYFLTSFETDSKVFIKKFLSKIENLMILSENFTYQLTETNIITLIKKWFFKLNDPHVQKVLLSLISTLLENVIQTKKVDPNIFLKPIFGVINKLTTLNDNPIAQQSALDILEELENFNEENKK
jgi:hypothetical protein